MKKLIAIVLLLVMVLTLCACNKESGGNDDGGNAADPLTGVFSMGYSRVNITPDYSVPLGGYGNTSERMSNGFYSYLFATCVVFSDESGNTVMIFQNDLSGCNKGVMDPIKEEISKETGIPVGNIMVAGTHTHSAPDMGNTAESSIMTYRQDVKKWMIQAAKEAMADRAEVTKLTTGRIQLPANTLNFIRHYVTEAGTVKGDNFGDLDTSTIVAHVRDADADMQVIRFERKDTKAVSMINWQTHPHRGGGSKNLNMTADLVGAFRDKYEKNTGDLFVYYTGASGNINPSSRISDENVTSDFKEQGEALADYAIQCFNENMTESSLGKVQMMPYTFSGEVNHTEDYKVGYAQTVNLEWTTNNNFTAAVKLANQYGINSPYHAAGIISKAQLGKTYDVEMYAFCIGDAVGFVTAPYEMYSEQGEYIKEYSPFEHTVVITCCNNGIGYIPSVEGYDNNSYGANTGKFVSGTGELLAEQYVAMLKELYDNN